jgi:hypothetical protein
LLHPLGAVLLAIFDPVMAVPFVLLHGAGNGMLTIARGTPFSRPLPRDHARDGFSGQKAGVAAAYGRE